jgi:LAO/AO transport system kinase
MAESLISGILKGDRRALAKAITLIESTRIGDRHAARELVSMASPHSGKSLRLGLSGAPGVGKSTFIEALGLHLVSNGHRVAVLAIDPSSMVSGGSILGDKTRMERLSVNEAAFVRPSPSSGTLGGVTDHTREAILLCEAAGFDIVLVETVGVGQSEVAVAAMTDCFVVLQLPNAGDELQAIKRGVLELADFVVVNKADLELTAATRALSYLRNVRPQRPVHAVSSRTGDGISDLWDAIDSHMAVRVTSGERDAQRRRQVTSTTRTNERPFRILGVQQIAIAGDDKQKLRKLWVDLLGIEPVGHFVSVEENVDEDVCVVGEGPCRVEIDLMQPLDPGLKPAVQTIPLNHVGLWVDDLPAALKWLTGRGLRFAPGGIRKGASGHDVCFVHPKPNAEFPISGEGVLIELVQAPPDMSVT